MYHFFFQILNSITEDILGNSDGFRGVPEQIEYIKSVYSRASADPLFIIIHNLDGPMLRAAKTQTVLAHLAALTSIHVVASFDHINAPLSNAPVFHNILMFQVVHLNILGQFVSYFIYFIIILWFSLL